MRIVEVDGRIRVYYRQSWVNTYLTCGERGRRDLIPDETTGENEYACLGTAFHAGVEAALSGAANTPFEVAEAACARLTELEPLFEYKDLTRQECTSHLGQWGIQLRRTEEFMQLRNDECAVEVPFEIYIATHPRFPEVDQWWEGTIDAINYTRRYMVDWKTSSRQYQRWERQRWAVQPTVYTEFGRVTGALDTPSDFRYLVFQRDKKSTFAQSVKVTRGPEHTRWLASMLWKPFDDRHADEWQLNDQHALCSPKWCPYWDDCKGAFIADDFNTQTPGKVTVNVRSS